jgi:hypothetical protein
MKRFIISVLCVSVFFIGLGGLVEQTSAKFKSDARALELIRLARVAVGGDANIRNVRSMTITGTTTHTFETNGIAETKQGTLEINFELPDKYSKMVRIGNPGDGAAEMEVQKQVDVIVMKKDDGTTDIKDLGDGRKVVIVRDGDGNVLTENIKGGGDRKIIVKKKDGTVITENIEPGDDSAVWTTEDDRKIKVDKDVKIARTGESGAMRQNEMFRTTLALLLSAPEGLEVSYIYAGETTLDGAAANIIDVESNGSKFKLYLDKTTNLPKMISYLGAPMKVMTYEKPASADGAAQKDVKVFVRKMEVSEMVEHQVRFSDFRSVGGLLLPYKWTTTVGGNAGETVDIANYEINPANIADKFQNQKVFIRQAKEQ